MGQVLAISEDFERTNNHNWPRKDDTQPAHIWEPCTSIPTACLVRSKALEQFLTEHLMVSNRRLHSTVKGFVCVVFSISAIKLKAMQRVLDMLDWTLQAKPVHMF